MAAYQPIQMPGGSGDFGDVVDRILRARQASQQAEAQRAEMLLKQQQLTQNQQLQAAQIQNYQSEAAHRTAAEAEQKRLGTRQEHLDVANAIPKIRDMLTPGHGGYDPEAGMSLARAYGINLAAKAPQMPDAPSRPAEMPLSPLGQDAGPVRPPDVTSPRTSLDPSMEAKFQQWKATLPTRLQSDSDYDLRGFFRKNPNWSLDQPDAHMTDEFKLPNHPTFSNESRNFNPETKHLAGKWNGDVFVPFDSRYKRRTDESANPVPTPEGGVDAISGGPAPPEVAQNTANAQRHEADMAAYRAQLAVAQKRQPTYSGTSPVGPVNIDPNAIIAAREEERQRQQQQLSPLTGAVDADFQPVVQAMVKAGMPPSEIAKAVSDYRKQTATEARDKEFKPTVAQQDKWHQLTYQAAMAGNRVRATLGEEHAPSQGEAENAARGRNMTLALSELQGSGLADYVPSPAVTQKWLSNQDQIVAAQERNKSTTGQVANWALRKADSIPASEYDGLSEKDKKYFTLVRQYVEPYARKQSGAAISASEWQNFLAQIGPQAGAPGSKLAHQAAEDMVTLGGRATRRLEKSDAAKRPRDDERATTLKNGGKPSKSIDDLVREAGGG